MRNNRTILHNLLALEIFNFSHFKMSYRINGWWSDAGTQESYRKANEVIENNLDSKLVKILEMMN